MIKLLTGYYFSLQIQVIVGKKKKKKKKPKQMYKKK